MTPAVLKLIEKQKAMLEIRQRLGEADQRPGRITDGGVSYGPCLLISRECGSGGTTVARLTATKLGWEFFDKEIVDEVSHLAHARLNLVESVDEKVRSQWENTWRPLIDPEDLGCENYQRYLREVIFTLGHHGDVVLLGRGAQYLLPTRCALRVRLVAPLEQRARRISELKGLNLAEGRAFVQHVDEERTHFIRKCFKADATSISGYDLVINMAEIGFDEAAELVLSGLRQKLGVVTKG